jgi:hypothetical protein
VENHGRDARGDARLAVDQGTERQFNERTAMPAVGVLETKGAKSQGEGSGVYTNDRRQTGRPGGVLALAERGVNILAFQSYVEEGESLARFLTDDKASAKAVLGRPHMIFEETDVAVAGLAHRPGELGRAGSRLGEKQTDIDYTYSGLEPGSTLGPVVFGADSFTKAAALPDELAAEDA